MYLRFAWRYFRSPKSTHAIQIISWITTLVIAFATCCQLLVLSVYNGFEDLVKSMYSSFYSEMKIVPREGKYLHLDENMFQQIESSIWVQSASKVLEEKALLQNGQQQSVIQLKGVDKANSGITGVSKHMREGVYDLGDAESPGIVVGSGVRQATGILLDPAFGPDKLMLYLSKPGITSNNPLASLSQGAVTANGSFAIQQEFDNSYALTNIDFVRQQIGLHPNRYSSIEIKLKNPRQENKALESLEKITKGKYIIQNRYQQNVSLYKTLQTEKWVIYAVLTLILAVAAFNLISALTMLILEKKNDIEILMSMGATESQIKRIFLSEGMLLGLIGTAAGMGIAWLLGLAQAHYHLIPIQGSSFMIDYFPVKFIWTDAALIASTSGCIIGLSSWLPARAAARSRSFLNINNQ